jgi:hypothetical protein
MTTRRTFLAVGLAGGAALAVAWCMRGSRDGGGAPAGDGSLSALDPAAPAIVAAIVPAMLDGALPATGDERSTAIAETVGNVGRAIAGLPPDAQHELAQLFSLLGLPPVRIALARVGAPWSEASPATIAAFLERWRDSGWSLQRTAAA